MAYYFDHQEEVDTDLTDSSDVEFWTSQIAAHPNQKAPKYETGVGTLHRTGVRGPQKMELITSQDATPNLFDPEPLLFDDETIRRYFELGCEVKGLGRGHVKRIKDEVNSQKNS